MDPNKRMDDQKRSANIKRLVDPNLPETERKSLTFELESQKDLLTPAQLFRFAQTRLASNQTGLLTSLCALEKLEKLAPSQLFDLFELAIANNHAHLQNAIKNLLTSKMTELDEPSILKFSQMNLSTQLTFLQSIHVKAVGGGAPPDFLAALDETSNLCRQNQQLLLSLQHKNTQPLFKTVSIILPSPARCLPAFPVATSNFHHFLSPTVTDQKFPICYIDVDLTGFHKVHATGQLTLALSGTFPQNSSLDIFVASIKKTPNSNVVTYGSYISYGHLSNDSPTHILPTPIPKIDSPTFRIVCKDAQVQRAGVPFAQEKKEQAEEKDAVVAPQKNTIVISKGEIHQFTIADDEPMASVLTKACSRFEMYPESDFQIEDVNYQTYAKDLKFGEYLKKGGAPVLRIKKKPLHAGAPAAANFQLPGGPGPFNFAPQQQQQQPPLGPGNKFQFGI